MKRFFSGLKPTGQPQLGNYIGAMRRWGDLSNIAGQECLWFIPNLHALTARPQPAVLARNTRAAAAWLMAVGAEPSETIHIFRQSDVPAHAELAWVLNNFATLGELNRMTQFKDKAQKLGAEGQLVGLYDYPVLMAADILLYDADEVPVGEDQKQHVELTRDIAERFNNLYGDVFRVPEATVQTDGARVMDLQNPTIKMSKSDDSAGCIYLEDKPEVIRQKVRRAVTDSGSVVQATDDKPALTNLLAIYSQVDGRSIAQLEETYAGQGYGEFKNDLAERLVETLQPIQERFRELMKPDSELDGVLQAGAEYANGLAQAKIENVYKVLGIK